MTPSKTCARNTTGSAPNGPDAPHPRHQHPALRASVSSGRASQASRRLGAQEVHARRLWRAHSGTPRCRRSTVFRARLRASAAELLAAGLRDFSFFGRDLPSGPVAPDPKDSYLLALAEASQAEFLVTGDKELLSLKQHKSTRIITPAAMIEILKKAESGRAPDSGRL